MDIEDNSNANNFEEHIKNPPNETLVYNFLDLEKNCDLENLMSIFLSQEHSPIGILKKKNSEELNYATLFYEHPRDEKITKNFSYLK
jgi:hypothetical protein